MFLVLALPRSRTHWLSKFLTYGDYECGHEEVRHLRTMEDARLWMSQDHGGSAETGLAPWWRLIRKMNPDTRIVIVRRPVQEVVDSLMRLDMTGIGAFDRADLTRRITRLDAKLDQIEARVPGVLSVKYDDLSAEETCKRVFEYCLPYQHDHEWWEALSPVNLQVNVRSLMRYQVTYQGQLAKLQCAAKHAILATFALRPMRDLNGVTIQQEDFEACFHEGVKLFGAHAALVGEPENAWEHKNLPLLRRLNKAGVLQVTVARSNGRVFGYLMAHIYPSLESPDITCAVHSTFFASPEFRGLGLRLQRSSVAALTARGITEIYWRDGVRAEGGRMGALYRRLGAEDFGRMYKLQLEAA